jgi:hypothetical protein
MPPALSLVLAVKHVKVNPKARGLPGSDVLPGRRGVLVSALAALAIGASAAIVNFFAEAGDKVR